MPKRLFPAVIMGMTLLTNISFAYDAETTHRALTGEIIDFYNSIVPSEARFDAGEKAAIIRGSVDEDTPPRWINHFYDPVHGTGWTGDKAGTVSKEVASSFSRAVLSFGGSFPAPEWADNYYLQQENSSYGGNHSWKEGIDAYANGDKKEAYYTLGHILHLIEDMSVPDHTRDDTHAQGLGGITGDEGSPYESYTVKWNEDSIRTLRIPEILKGAKAEPPQYSSVGEYLASMSAYSNRYFFSKDTINDLKYEFPKIVRDDGDFGYGIDENGKEFPLVKILFYKKGDGTIEKRYVIKNLENYYPILDAYFIRLSPRVVLNGAGLISLFMKQADETKTNLEYKKAANPLAYAVKPIANMSIIPVLSVIGTMHNLGLDKLYNSFATVIGQIGQTASEIIPADIKDVAGGQTIIQALQSNIYPAKERVIVAATDNGTDTNIAGTDTQNTLSENVPTQPVQGETQNTPLPVADTVSPQTTAPVPVVPVGGSGPVSSPQQPTTSAENNQPATTTENSSSTGSSSSTPARTAPTINSFAAVYNTAPRFDFSWLPSADSEGSTTTEKYSIYDTTDASSSFVIYQTTSTGAANYSFAHPVTETGRNYEFKFLVEDAQGLSNSTTVTIFATTPLPSQLNKDDMLGAGGAQKIFVQSAASITSVAFYVSPDGGSYCCSASFVKIYKDNNDDLGALIDSSAENTLGQYDSPRELVYTFSSPVSLEASSSYWLFLKKSDNSNGTLMYGNASDPYAGGYYSGNANADAYFRLIQ